MTTMNWTEEQDAIFSHFADPDAGHLIVEALAGTGKSTTACEGIRRAPEKSRTYFAFNKVVVEEMKAKIGDPNVNVQTFNSAGYQIVRANWFGVRPDDEVETARIDAATEKLFPRLTDSKYKPLGVMRKLIGFAKNTIPRDPTLDEMHDIATDLNLDIEGYTAQLGWTLDAAVAVAHQAVLDSKRKDPSGRISFNDQVWLPVVMGWVRARFDLVVVDEMQDMNAVQLAMAEKLFRSRFIGIGDRDQALYGFRGADSSGMERVRTKLKAKTLPLTRTYRCGKSIVALAKTLIPAYQAADQNGEGVVRKLGSLDAMEADLRPGDAVVSRVNAPLAGICLGLLRRGVPAYIAGRDIGKELASTARDLAKGCSDVKDFMTRVDTWAERKLSRVKDGEAGERQAAAIIDTADTLCAFAESARAVGDIATRIEELFMDASGVRRPSVVCSSTHRAKGLEWNRVYVLTKTYAVQPGQLNVPRSENRCLAYVAWTRAKHELVLVAGDWKGRISAKAKRAEPTEEDFQEGDPTIPRAADTVGFDRQT